MTTQEASSPRGRSTTPTVSGRRLTGAQIGSLFLAFLCGICCARGTWPPRLVATDAAGPGTVAGNEPAPHVAADAAPLPLLSTAAATAIPATASIVPRPVAPEGRDYSTNSSPEPARDRHRIELIGRLAIQPHRSALLSLATPEPIAHIDVRPGDRVQKGWQVFSHWESPDRLQAVKMEVQRVQRQRDLAKVRVEAAAKVLARYRRLKDRVSPQELEDAATMAAVREQELAAAEAAVAEVELRYSAAEFEFSQAFVTSPIDGMVATVKLSLGERRTPADPTRGVLIIDPRQLDCHCQLPLAQLQQLRQMLGPLADASAEAESSASELRGLSQLEASIRAGSETRRAQIISLGVMAQPGTNAVPLLLTVDNAAGDLYAETEVEVTVQLPPAKVVTR